MKCPRCTALIRSEDTICPQCRFSASHLHRTIGSQWVRLQRLTDAAQCLRLEDLRKTEILLNDFERRFPQAFFSAYIGALPVTMSVSELGFWLLNQGAFDTQSINRRNDYGLMLVIDPSAKHVSLTLGYSLEGWFTESQITTILRKAGRDLSRNAFASAIARVCRQCSRIMQKNARRCVWAPEGQNGVEHMENWGLETLRTGNHQSPAKTQHTRNLA